MRIAFNIKWETDGYNVDLPNEVEIPDSIPDDEDSISDYLSNTYGYLHYGFMIREI